MWPFKKKVKEPAYFVRVALLQNGVFTTLFREMLTTEPEKAVSRIAEHVNEAVFYGSKIIVRVPGIVDTFAINGSKVDNVSVSLVVGEKT